MCNKIQFLCFFAFVFLLIFCVDAQNNTDSIRRIPENTRVNTYPATPNNGSIWVNRETPYKNYTPAQLLKYVFMEDTMCSRVSNITFQGTGWNGTSSSWTQADRSLSYFSHGTANLLGMESGLLLSTGGGLCAEGPSQSGSGMGGGVQITDPNLSAATTSQIKSGAKLEFDFIPSVTKIFFLYVFASEEYPSFSSPGSSFNDVFGFFITGPGITGTRNIATIPHTNTPITITNISQYVNTQYFVSNVNLTNSSQVLPGRIHIEYNGQTVLLSTDTVSVVPGETYHLKLAIANVGDDSYGSGVFLKAGSFKLGYKIESFYDDMKSDSLYAGCTVNKFVLYNPPQQYPVTKEVRYSGIARNDLVSLDGSPLPDFVTVPPDSDHVEICYKVKQDITQDGGDFTISYDSECGIEVSKTVFVYKHDLELFLSDTSFCNTPVINMSVVTSLDHLLWSTGETTNSIDITVSGTYSLTATNDHNCIITIDTVFLMCEPQLLLNDMKYSDIDNQTFNTCSWTILGGFPFEQSSEGDHIYWYINGFIDQSLTDIKEWNIVFNPGTYTIEELYITNKNAHFSKIATINIETTPIGFIINPGSLCDADYITLQVNDYNLYNLLWNTGNTTNTIEVADSGLYFINAIEDSTQCNKHGEIFIETCPYIIAFPPVMAITPTKGETNCCFMLPNTEVIESIDLYIYDSNKKIVFHTQDKYFKWNGLEKGKLKGINLFVYHIKYTLKNNSKSFQASGTITVL